METPITTNTTTTTTASTAEGGNISLELAPVNQHIEIMQVDHTGALTQSMATPSHHSTSSDPVQKRVHTVVDFLQRPQPVGEISWSSIDARGTTLLSLDFPIVLLQLVQLAQKIIGFKFFRCKKAVVTLLPNAQPFQQGILALRNIPLPSQDLAFDSQLDTMTTFTGLEGCELSLSDLNDSTLDIPFVFPVPSIDITQSPIPVFGRFEARVLSELYGPTLTFTVLAHFEDVEVSMPTSELPAEELIAPVRKAMAVRMNKHVGVSEKEQQNSGTISGLLAAGGSIATMLSGIPLIGELASTIGVGLNLGASLAALFGFSKPTSDKPSQLVKIQIADGMQNADGVDAGHNMGLLSRNHINLSEEVFGEKFDEMALAAIQKIPALTGQFSWGITDAPGKLLAQYNLNPVTLGTVITNSPPLRKYAMIPLAWLSSFFNYWRGSYNFRLLIAKTRFHAGKIVIVYFNSDTNLPTVMEDANYYNYTKIIDLQTTSEILFKVPYIQTEPWKNVDTSSTYSSSSGKIGIYSLTTLSRTENVRDTIDFNVFVHGGADFKFSMPRRPTYNGAFLRPFVASTSLIGARGIIENLATTTHLFIRSDFTNEILAVSEAIPDNPESLNVTSLFESLVPPEGYQWLWSSGGQAAGRRDFQIELGESPTPVYWSRIVGAEARVARALVGEVLFQFRLAPITRIDKHVGREKRMMSLDFPSIVSDLDSVSNDIVEDNTVGESIVSLRSLCKRYNYYQTVATGRNAPGLIDCSLFNGESSCIENNIMAAYRAFRGSRRFNFVPQSGRLTDTINISNTLNTDSNNPPSFVESANAVVPFFPWLEGMKGIEVPFYGRNHFTILGDTSSRTIISPNRNVITLETHQTALQQIDAFHSIGEDFSFGCFLAPPIMVSEAM